MAQTQGEHYDGYTDHLEGRALGSLTDEDIRSIAETWLLAALKGFDLFALQTVHARNQHRPNPDDLEYRATADAATAARIKAIYQTDLKARRVEGMAAEADKQLAIYGVTCDPLTEGRTAFDRLPPMASPNYLKTCHELLKARVSFYDAVTQAAQGDYTAHDRTVETIQKKQARKDRGGPTAPDKREETAPVQADPASPKLSEALTQYLDQREREGKIDALSRERTESKFEVFQAVVAPDGTLPVKRIGAQHLQSYRRVLFGFPANRTKRKAYRDLPLAQILEDAASGRIPKEDRISQQTIITYCQPVISFLKWAGTNEYHFNSSITGNLNVDKPERTEEEERDPYTPADIQKLFNPATFLTAGMRQPAKATLPNSGGKASRYWVPLLGLFTGARLEELAQLHLDDIVLVDQQRNRRRLFTIGQPAPHLETLLAEAEQQGETLCIFINESKPYQRLKNKPSRRFVPLSSLLIQDLHFLDYVSWIHDKAATAEKKGTARKDNGRLFPELKKTASANKYGHKLSHWYGEYRKRVGVVGGEDGEGKKVFHSFRHTISDWCLQQQDIQETAAVSYLGHKQESITFDIYAKGTLPHVLFSSITSPFTEYVRSCLDVEGLKASVWAGKNAPRSVKTGAVERDCHTETQTK